MVLALCLAKKARANYYQKKFNKRTEQCEKILDKWNKEKFSDIKLTWKVGPFAAWLEICHEIIEYGVYAEFGQNRGFAADSDIYMTTSPDLLSKAPSRLRHKESWSFSRNNTNRSGINTPNYFGFITPEKSQNDNSGRKWKNRDKILAGDKSIPECNSEIDNQDPDIMLKTVKEHNSNQPKSTQNLTLSERNLNQSSAINQGSTKDPFRSIDRNG